MSQLTGPHRSTAGADFLRYTWGSGWLKPTLFKTVIVIEQVSSILPFPRRPSALLPAVLALAVSLGLMQPAPAVAQGFEKYRDHTEFDDHFRKYSKRFFGVGFDWHYFKAQGIAESNLNPSAESAVGAKGIMQLMPRTFDEVSNKSAIIEGSLMDPRWNIAAGIWYNKHQFDYWQKGRGLEERLRFMYGSYNTGRVNLRKAQREAINRGLNPRQWSSMQQALPAVTGRHSRETINYVERIFEIKEAIQ